MCLDHQLNVSDDRKVPDALEAGREAFSGGMFERFQYRHSDTKQQALDGRKHPDPCYGLR